MRARDSVSTIDNGTFIDISSESSAPVDWMFFLMETYVLSSDKTPLVLPCAIGVGLLRRRRRFEHVGS